MITKNIVIPDTKTRGEVRVSLLNSELLFAESKGFMKSLGTNFAKGLNLKVLGCNDCGRDVRRAKNVLTMLHGKDAFSQDGNLFSLRIFGPGVWMKYSIKFTDSEITPYIEVRNVEDLESREIQTALRVIDWQIYKELSVGCEEEIA